MSLRGRKKDTSMTESSKPHQWEKDEIQVKEGNCCFEVKYLGSIEVRGQLHLIQDRGG